MADISRYARQIEEKLRERDFVVKSQVTFRGLSGITHRFDLEVSKGDRRVFICFVQDEKGFLSGLARAIDVTNCCVIVATNSFRCTFDGRCEGGRILIAPMDHPNQEDNIVQLVTRRNLSQPSSIKLRYSVSNSIQVSVEVFPILAPVRPTPTAYNSTATPGYG